MGQGTSKGKKSGKSSTGKHKQSTTFERKADDSSDPKVQKTEKRERDHSYGYEGSHIIMKSPQGTVKGEDPLEKMFQKYKDSEEDAILAEGMLKFCEDLEVDPTEFIVLVLAWKFGAKQMCKFTREEFFNGLKSINSSSISSLKASFPKLKDEIKLSNKFQNLYQFTFGFGLDHGSGQRVLPVEMAVPLWELVFSQQPPDILARWCNFLRAAQIKGISKDTWNLFLPFSLSVSSDLTNYDESEAWPSLFDDFVEYEKYGQSCT